MGLASLGFGVLAVMLWVSDLPHRAALRVAAAASGVAAVVTATACLSSRRDRKTARLELAVESLPRDGDGTYVGQGFSWLLEDAQKITTDGELPIRGRLRPLFLPNALLSQHTLLLGTTGVGKTRMLELLITQAIERGDAVIVLDPKGDDRLLQFVQAATRRAGRAFRYVSLPTPHRSDKYDPIGTYAQIRDVADRVAAILPSDGEALSFRNYAWEVVDVISRALVVAQESLTFAALKRFAVDDPWALVRILLERRYPKTPRPKERPSKTYEELRDRGKLEACPELDALISLASRPREHYFKMVNALVPALTKLAGCEVLGEGLSWRQVDEGRQVAYFFLGSMLGYETANAVAKMALLDFQSFVGRRYLEHRKEPISLFVDELGDVLTPEFVNILNKSRGAGIRVTACAQTLADFEAAIGSRAKALQVMGNVNTVFQFRAQSTVDAEAFGDLGGRRLIRVKQDGAIYEPTLFNSAARGPDDFRAAFTQQNAVRELPLVPAWAIQGLPTFHYFARWGGKLYRGFVPLLSEGPPPSESP